MPNHLVDENTLKLIVKSAILEADVEKEKKLEGKFLQKVDMTNRDHIVSHDEWKAFKGDWDSVKSHIRKLVIGAIVVFILGAAGTGIKMSMGSTKSAETPSVESTNP